MVTKFKPKYKVHYCRHTKQRWVTIGDNPKRYYISKVIPAGTSKPHYLLLPKRDFIGVYYPTVRDAVYAITYTRGAI